VHSFLQTPLLDEGLALQTPVLAVTLGRRTVPAPGLHLVVVRIAAKFGSVV